jgi:hydroxymethylpyrimidine/phosphomethylpyrimidine kinase
MQEFPLVLAIGGHDPCGGAGLQADIEAIAANGCRALSVVSALTTQDTCGVYEVYPQAPEQILRQCRILLEDSPVCAIKIGLLGDAEIAVAIAQLLAEQEEIPVVLDPVLASGSGSALADRALREAILNTLSPYCQVMTPNSPEARALSGLDTLDDCARRLIDSGCASVMITGAHETTDAVSNRLYDAEGLLLQRDWPRLPNSFHGSGCTLASAFAAGLAKQMSLSEAADKAQDYAWRSLYHGFKAGRCQHTPNRFYALRNQ